MYINTLTQEYPVSRKQIRDANPNVSLPRDLTDSVVNTLGYAVVLPAPTPVGDVVTEGIPSQQPDGTWLQTWDTRAFTAEELASTLEQKKLSKKQEIRAGYEEDLSSILNEYTDAETKTWDKQEEEARAYTADNTASVPMLEAIALAKGVTVGDVAARVIANADAWIQISGTATGKRQALEEAVDAATTIADVEAVTW